MRQETNNEMDLMLRRLGRQQETAASSDHLDADELSSFAENALPPAARARYTEHLAECSRCRDLVVQLSSSAGAVVAQESAKVFAPSALRKFLASFFSPMVLRYAVPALGLVIVAAIGFIVSREPGTANSPVAEVRDQQPIQAPVPASQPQPSASTDKDLYGFRDNKEPNKAVPQQGEAAAQAGAVAPSASTVAADASQDRREKSVEEAPPVTKEAPAPTPTPAVSELKKLEPQERKQEAAQQTVTVQSDTEKLKRDDRSGVADFAVAAPSAARNRAAAPGGVASAAGAAKPMAQAKEAEKDAAKDEDDAETRTVAGRRFRKQGSVWVDTAYTAPRRITAEYTRGSEGYRTLVGDEPEIKRIADQLDGEIIVVWKGQVYKIR